MEIGSVGATSKKRKRRIVYSDEKDEDEVSPEVDGESDLDLNKRKISVGCFVIFVNGRYTNFFASVKNKCGKLWNVEYFQPKCGEWTRENGDEDSRFSHELMVACGLRTDVVP